jgi:hypothetical protein
MKEDTDATVKESRRLIEESQTLRQESERVRQESVESRAGGGTSAAPLKKIPELKD